MLPELWHRIKISFNPYSYHEIADEEMRTTLTHVPLMVGVGFLIWLILVVPTLLTLADSIESQLSSFTKFELGGTVEAVDSFGLPLNNPKFVIDLTQERRIEKETVLLTKQYFYFNTLGGAKRIPINKITHPLEYRAEFAEFSLLAFLFFLPSILFYGYLGFLVKYALIIGITLAVVLFTCKVLLIIGMPVRRIINVTIYAATPMVLLETIVAPLKDALLFPLFDVMGVNFYALSLGIYLGLVISGLYAVEHAELKASDGSWNF